MTAPVPLKGSTGVPTIVGAFLVAGHDGAAEAVIEIAHPNGAVQRTQFSADALAAALGAEMPNVLGDLIGRPWTVLISSPTTCEA